MALQEMKIKESDIVPQKSLNDIDSMYHLCAQRLDTAQQITDLIPFIKKLMTITELKQHLKSTLDAQYQTAKDSKDDNNKRIKCNHSIRSLFISLFALNGIPSNNIHAHILSFLSSWEYRILPKLSKHFKYVLNSNPYLYINHGYTNLLSFDTIAPKLNPNKDTFIMIHHGSMGRDPAGVAFGAIPDQSKFDPTMLTKKDIDTLTPVISHFKSWRIKEHSHHNDSTHNNKDADFFQDGHNKFILDFLSRHVHKIEKLHIALRQPQIIKQVLDIVFKNCIVLSISESRDLSFNENSFRNLQYLDVTTSDNWPQINVSIENVNTMMKFTQNTLKCVRCTFKHTAPVQPQTETLHITSNIEWCSIQDKNKTIIDLSKCNKLIGLQLFGIDTKNIRWPTDSNYIIPFGCIGYKEDQYDEWKSNIMNKELDIKFLSLFKRDEPDNEQLQSPWFFDNYQWKYHESSDMKYVDINTALLNTEDANKCIVLDKKSSDWESKLLFKILEYAIKDEKIKTKVNERCETWWNLFCARWVRYIGVKMNHEW